MPEVNSNVEWCATEFAQKTTVHNLNIVYNNHTSQPKECDEILDNEINNSVLTAIVILWASTFEDS